MLYNIEGLPQGKEDFVDADFLLIRKMRQGDEDAFDTFVRKYYGDILKYCTYHSPDAAYAEDLTQETFVRFFAKFSDYRHRGKVKNYLYTIAGNLCRNCRRDQSRRFSGAPEAISSEQPRFAAHSDITPYAAAGHESAITDRLTLEWGLSQLAPELREIVILYYFQEMELKEAAELLHIGLPLAKYRLQQARHRLKVLLQEQEQKPPEIRDTENRESGNRQPKNRGSETQRQKRRDHNEF